MLLWFSNNFLTASPHLTGIVDQIPSEELMRGLKLLSKVTIYSPSFPVFVTYWLT